MPKAALTVWMLSLVVVGCAANPGPPVVTDDSPAGRLASMTWMAGSWIGKTEAALKKAPGEDDSLWEAHYTAPSGGLMLGMTKRYQGGQCMFFEYEVFSIEDGKLVVRPYLQGDKSDSFALKSLDRATRRAVFENPDHAPSTLDYWRLNDDTLVISVTSPPATGETSPRGFRLVMKRPGS
jgi:Domain of unknown function (DUF6265)